MSYNFEKRHEDIPNILNPDGINLGPIPFVTKYGLVLPGIQSSISELQDLYALVISEAGEDKEKRMILPTAVQLNKIVINPDTGCWELPIYGDGHDVYPEGSPQAGQSRARYGRLSVSGLGTSSALAHRDMYIALIGVFPKGFVLDHLCENPRCCWPRHLEPVTPADNTRRYHHARRLEAGQGILF